MNLFFVFWLNNVLLGFALAMDAFSVSVANCINERHIRFFKMSAIALTFAFFQAAMPLIGWACVCAAVKAFSVFQKIVPFVALVLLAFIGGKMIYEGVRENKLKAQCNEIPPDFENKVSCSVPAKTKLSFGVLMVQGVATSIDALSVGFTLAEYNSFLAVVAALIIAGVTFVVCFAGCIIGKKIGEKFSSNATIIGGIILVAIGIEIFAKNFLSF